MYQKEINGTILLNKNPYRTWLRISGNISTNISGNISDLQMCPLILALMLVGILVISTNISGNIRNWSQCSQTLVLIFALILVLILVINH